VIICTRDRPQMLTAALASLLAAVPAECEVLVVDSASKGPETRRAALDAGVRYVRSDVPGLSIARNLGLTTATRPIAVFSDDDCALDREFLAPLIAPFSDPRIAATTGLLRDESDALGASAEPVATLTKTKDGLDAGHGALMAFRRDTIAGMGGFDPLLGAGRHFGGAEDLDAMCRLLHGGQRVARVPASVVRHVNTRDDHDYVALTTNYGLGLGAMCAKWLRGAPADGLVLTVRVLRRAAVRYLRGVRSTRSRRGQAALIRGVLRGMWAARRIPASELMFADENPPTPVGQLPAHPIDNHLAGAES
jgi:glycosyltransferase involved in cell wall biosynthesis